MNNPLRTSAAAALLMLSACAGSVHPREGSPVDRRWPQAAEQCAAQPKLAWC
jgi:hypothetical protein